MCIISFQVKNHPIYKLILLANRDEFYGRPTKKAHFWGDHPNLLAGRDLQAMGTWMGITKQGRIAALTNYRDPKSEKQFNKSRGDIVTSFLTSNILAEHFLSDLQDRRHEYDGFNLIVGTVDQLFYYSKQENDIVTITPGTYSVSNAALNTPWPKVEKARQTLEQYVKGVNEIEMESLFAQLHDNEIARDEVLPKTGVELDLERQLSPIFIQTENYGTRCSTVLLVTHNNKVTFTERTFNQGNFKEDVNQSFQIQI